MTLCQLLNIPFPPCLFFSSPEEAIESTGEKEEVRRGAGGQAVGRGRQSLRQGQENHVQDAGASTLRSESLLRRSS